MKKKDLNPEVRNILAATRVNVEEMAKLRSFAHAFTNGDVSKWVRLAALNPYSVANRIKTFRKKEADK